jgi:endonuclease/exonuclease/phosphatase family metal-dependent hydrolase
LRIRVLSYNIHRAIGLDRRFRPMRIASIVAHHDPDIVLLQEVDEGVPRSREMNLAHELADALAFPHLAVSHNVTLWRGRYGNATLSRFPIIKKTHIDLTVGRRKRRGCQHTRLAIEAGTGTGVRKLDIFNLHLGLSAREREQQVELLRDSAVFESLSEEQPCLVAGDFNDWRSLLMGPLTELGFRRAGRTAKGNERRSRATFPSFFPQGELDRMYYRGPIRSVRFRPCELRVSRIASDHLPIVADFDLR